MSEPAWVGLKDEELLGVRICDLGLSIRGSELETRVAQLYAELGARGLQVEPPCYLGDEWFSPNGVPAIAIPFYLAHPRLKALERSQMLEVEGGTHAWCLQLLRHECGHAYEHAYRLSSRPGWRKVFGDPDTSYAPEFYRPRPYSRSFVRHLPNWYAQAHPEEDFAETFAVWLGVPAQEWQERYRGWKAIEKHEYVDTLFRRLRRQPPRVRSGRWISDASKLKRTLARYYAERRRLWAEEQPDFYDRDLLAIFAAPEPGRETAARMMRRQRARIVSSVVRWTGQHKYTVDALVRRLTERCESLGLVAREGDAQMLELGSYLSALVTNHLYTGRFKRSV